MTHKYNLTAKKKLSVRFPKFRLLLDWLDVLAIGAWGVLLLNYWLTEKLVLLIHPRYIGLTIVTGFALLLIAAFKARGLWRKSPILTPNVQHLSAFPPGLTSEAQQLSSDRKMRSARPTSPSSSQYFEKGCWGLSIIQTKMTNKYNLIP